MKQMIERLLKGSKRRSVRAVHAAPKVARVAAGHAKRIGAMAVPVVREERSQLLVLSLFYLVSGFSVLALQASPLDAPTLVVQEYNEHFLVKSKLNQSKKAVEKGVYLYLTRHMKDVTPQKAVRLTKLIASLARKNDFHPGLILSIIRVESNFRPWAVSPQGALGLMQIMPETGQWLARRHGLHWEGPVTLLDEEHNITMGVLYLDYLRGKYEGDLKKMLSAYNRGPAKVDLEVAEGRDGSLVYYSKIKEYLPKLAVLPKMNRNANVD